MKITKTDTKQTTRYVVKGSNYTIYLYNTSNSTRSGFNHFTTIEYQDDTHHFVKVGVKVHYINRTWECFRYESCMLKALDALKQEFKKDKKFLTKVKKIENLMIKKIRENEYKYSYINI